MIRVERGILWHGGSTRARGNGGANLSLREQNPASACSSRSLYTYKSIVNSKDSEFHLDSII